MTINPENSPKESAESNEVLSPGQLLQEARLQAGLSQEQIADSLRLRLQVIQDVEADSYDENLSLTFIKGYLKAYAKLVGVTESDVLVAYSQLFDAKEPNTELQSFSKRLSNETNDSRLMQFSYLLLFGLIVALVVWWWQQDSQLQQAEQDSLVVTPMLAQQAEPRAPSASMPTTRVEAPAPTVVISDSEALELSDTNTPASAEPEVIAEPPLSPPVPALEAAAEAEAVDDEIAAEQRLSLSFARNCWVEIKDASGARLAVGEKAAGHTMELTGQAPFKVVLGTAKGVEMRYQNQAVDLSAYKNGKVVKMTVPAN